MKRLLLARPTRRSFLNSTTRALLGVAAVKSAWTQPLRVAQTQTAPRTLRFGLNYVPRKNWWYAWNEWDRASISEDFDAIQNLGMDHIRIQCLWPIFQPGINHVSIPALDRLLELLNLADAANLDVQVTVLDGWLSGYSFLPVWVAPLAKDENIFTASRVIEAEMLLLQELATAIGQHKRFLGFDLGNEIDVEQDTDGNHATLEDADQWAVKMLGEAERLAPGRFHVNGVDHRPWFGTEGFSRSNLATTGSATVVHCYAYWTGALKQYRYNDTGSLHLLEYMVELAKAYHTKSNRLVWVEEVGTSAEWMPENYIPEYARSLLANAASCANVWGYTWWCSHDIDRAFKGFLNLEYDLGVLDTKNRVKPIGKTLARLAEELRIHCSETPRRSTAVVIPDANIQLNRWAVADRFMEEVQRGCSPALVLESRVRDEPYLRERGIVDLVRVRV